MKKSKSKSTNKIKDKAFSEFATGKYTQRQIAHKYKISEWGLSKYISEKLESLNSEGVKTK